MLRFITLFALAFLLSFNAGADTLESVMMPGKVIHGHLKWEDDCKQCHKKFDKEGQNQLCKDCHKDINKDVAQKKGFHGKLKESRNCVECHTEHKGRNAQIAPINEKTFKHSQTDFDLKGVHADATKTECKELMASPRNHRNRSRFLALNPLSVLPKLLIKSNEEAIATVFSERLFYLSTKDDIQVLS